MAITVGTTDRIRPYSSSGGKAPGVQVPMLMANSEVITIGDVIVFSTGKVADGNTDPTQDTIVGVAMENKTAAASAGVDDIINVALAMPNQVFVGSLVGGATTDQTGFTMGTHNDADFDLIELTVEAYPAIDVADTAGDVYIIGPAIQQFRGARLNLTTVVNPRVYFMFERTVFTNVLA